MKTVHKCLISAVRAVSNEMLWKSKPMERRELSHASWALVGELSIMALLRVWRQIEGPMDRCHAEQPTGVSTSFGATTCAGRKVPRAFTRRFQLILPARLTRCSRRSWCFLTAPINLILLLFGGSGKRHKKKAVSRATQLLYPRF